MRSNETSIGMKLGKRKRKTPQKKLLGSKVQ